MKGATVGDSLLADAQCHHIPKSDYSKEITQCVQNGDWQMDVTTSDSQHSNTSTWSELGDDLLEFVDTIESEAQEPTNNRSVEPTIAEKSATKNIKKRLFSNPVASNDSFTQIRPRSEYQYGARRSFDSFSDSSDNDVSAGRDFNQCALPNVTPPKRQKFSKTNTTARKGKQPLQGTTFESPVRRNLEAFNLK